MSEHEQTPRTDAVAVIVPLAESAGEGHRLWVPADFARQLERELSALKADAERYRFLRENRWTYADGLHWFHAEQSFTPEQTREDLDASIDRRIAALADTARAALSTKP